MDIKAYKGFDKDLKCRNFQYEVGKTYGHNGPVKACDSGFHACENPFDVWSYYGPFESRFCQVTLSGKTDKDSDDSKVAAAKITVEAELSLPEFVKDAVSWLVNATKGGKDLTDNGEFEAQIGSSGDYAQIGSSGDYAQIGSSGDYAKIGSSGDSAKIGSSGDSAKIGSSGYSAKIGSSGDYAQIGSSGDYAQIGSSGDSAKIGSSGDYAQIEAKGQDSVVSACGPNTTVSGADGTWISVAEYDDNGKCIGFATGCIGKDGLKADTAYKAEGRRLVEA